MVIICPLSKNARQIFPAPMLITMHPLVFFCMANNGAFLPARALWFPIHEHRCWWNTPNTYPQRSSRQKFECWVNTEQQRVHNVPFNDEIIFNSTSAWDLSMQQGQRGHLSRWCYNILHQETFFSCLLKYKGHGHYKAVAGIAMLKLGLVLRIW